MDFNYAYAKKDIIIHTIVYPIHICMEINCVFSMISTNLFCGIGDRLRKGVLIMSISMQWPVRSILDLLNNIVILLP